jgi:hypothetical protein
MCRTTTDAEASEIFDVLIAKRAEWAVEHTEGRQDFSVDILGGKWTKDNLGVAYDAFRGHAHRGEPEEFCVKWCLQKSFRCSVTTISEEVAHLVCTAWCSKMQFAYSKFLAEGDQADFCDNAFVGFVEDPAVARTWAAAAGPVRERLTKIRDMCLRPVG